MSAARRIGSFGLVSLVLFMAACSSVGDEVATDERATTSTIDDARQLSEPDGTEAAEVATGEAATETTSTESEESSTTDAPAAEEPAPSDDDDEPSTTTAPASGDSSTSSTAAPSSTTDAASPTTTTATAGEASPASSSSTSTTSTTTTSTTSTTTTSTTTTTTAAPAAFPDRIDLPSEVASTEGVASDPSTGRLFVGELNNGNVWSGTPAGGWTLFNSGGGANRSTAFGLAVDAARNRLYVVSGVDGRVDVLNLASGALVSSIAVPVVGGSLINDIGIAPDGTAYVTDTGAARLYRIAAGGSSAELWVDYSGSVDTNRTQHGNGVVADGGVVLVAYMERGELLRFDRSSGAVSVVAISGGSTAGRDGLVLCGNRLYGVEISSITGMEGVWVTDLNAARTAGTSQGRVGGGELAGASTAAALGGYLIVNNAQFGVSPKTSPYNLTVLDAAC